MQHENTYNDALPRQRSAGVCLHLTSLPGRYGIGDLGDSAFAFVDAMADMQLRVWQFLPTGPTAYGNSPYQPLSTFAGNESLIDTGGLVREGLITSNEADSLIGLPSDAVDYGRLIPAKDALLKRAARRFIAMPNAERKADYDAFLDQNDQAWLHDYALFRILKSRHGEQAWTEWDAAYAQRDANALARLEADCADEIETIKIQQFLFFSQWQSMRDIAAQRFTIVRASSTLPQIANRKQNARPISAPVRKLIVVFNHSIGSLNIILPSMIIFVYFNMNA